MKPLWRTKLGSCCLLKLPTWRRGCTAGDGEEAVHLPDILTDDHKKADWGAGSRLAGGSGKCKHRWWQRWDRKRCRRNVGQGVGKVPDDNVARMEHIWEVQRILDGKKSSLRKTYKTQPEANDKVWQLNENTEQALPRSLGDVLRAL